LVIGYWLPNHWLLVIGYQIIELLLIKLLVIGYLLTKKMDKILMKSCATRAFEPPHILKKPKLTMPATL
jgi:hypothetical protein